MRTLDAILPFRRTASAVAVLLLAAACAAPPQAGPAVVQAPATPARVVELPNLTDSFKFAVLGDFGTGDPEQYQLAAQMITTRMRFPYEIVILVGDNIYGSERPQDFVQKFERPYKSLLDADVKFYASLGNHDSREQRFYKPFNMEGQLYYSFSPKADVRFFALESTYMQPEQMTWLEEELKKSTDDWKIAFFHHPLYSSGERHGSDIRLRTVVEPVLLRYNVSVVFAGHDHFYERIRPQKGILHFVIGSGGKLRAGNIDRGRGLTAQGFDRDQSFLVAEIAGDQMTFQAITRMGEIVDSGIVDRRQPIDSGSQ